MDSLEQELLQDAEDDARTVEFIKNYLPQEVKDKFTDEELYYFLDVIVEYYANSGCGTRQGWLYRNRPGQNSGLRRQSGP